MATGATTAAASASSLATMVMGRPGGGTRTLGPNRLPGMTGEEVMELALIHI